MGRMTYPMPGERPARRARAKNETNDIYGARLLFWSRKNPWLWALLILAIWHECEHVYIIDCYIKTGMVGLPGLLALGGALWGGLPIGRPALHFLYTLFEETFIICSYLRTRRGLLALATF